MDFLTEMYRNVKLGVAGLGGVMSTTLIIVGIVATKGALGIAMIIGGSIWLSSSGFILFDSIKVSSLIRKDIEKLKKQTLEYKFENSRLTNSVNALKKVNDRFIESANKSEEQIKNLSYLKTGYEKALKEHRKLLNDEKNNSERLNDSVNKLTRTKQNLVYNVKELSNTIKANKIIMDELKIAKDKYIDENNKLQESVKNNNKEVKELKRQVTKLKELYKSTKILMRNLATAGDMFNEFNTTLGDTSEGLNETKEEYDIALNRMNKLVEKMKNNEFKELDQDGDGTITAKEFENYVNE